VIDPGGALFEQGSDEHDSQFFRDICELGGGGAGDGFCEIEERGILTLAKVLSLKKLGKADNLRATLGRVMDAFDGALQVFFRVGSCGQLHQSDVEVVRQWESLLKTT
jgi:hypothetical protein